MQLFFFFLVRLVLELRASCLQGRQSYCLSHSASPLFVMGFFKMGSRKLFRLGWLQTAIFLISASGVVRITDVNH
jgi:hypothetical protein